MSDFQDPGPHASVRAGLHALARVWYGAGFNAESMCDINLGVKALAVRARAGARVNRPSTKAPMLGAKKRKSRKARRGDK